jgi:hypothetical protein
MVFISEVMGLATTATDLKTSTSWLGTFELFSGNFRHLRGIQCFLFYQYEQKDAPALPEEVTQAPKHGRTTNMTKLA